MTDTTPLATTYAYTVDIRRIDTGAVQGVAVVAPSGRYLSLLAVGASSATTLELTDATWGEIDTWAADGNARLPAKPAPMTGSILAALVGGEPPSAVKAQRFAAIPITDSSREALSRMAGRPASGPPEGSTIGGLNSVYVA